ncbi:hypothetical protein CBL_12195 [Carabus blaptoides fortunei]
MFVKLSCGACLVVERPMVWAFYLVVPSCTLVSRWYAGVVVERVVGSVDLSALHTPVPSAAPALVCYGPDHGVDGTVGNIVRSPLLRAAHCVSHLGDLSHGFSLYCTSCLHAPRPLRTLAASPATVLGHRAGSVLYYRLPPIHDGKLGGVCPSLQAGCKVKLTRLFSFQPTWCVVVSMIGSVRYCTTERVGARPALLESPSVAAAESLLAPSMPPTQPLTDNRPRSYEQCLAHGNLR